MSDQSVEQLYDLYYTIEWSEGSQVTSILHNIVGASLRNGKITVYYRKDNPCSSMSWDVTGDITEFTLKAKEI